MNNALLYLGGILITALAVLFAVPRFVDWNSYRGVFEEEASRVLGREVRVGGAVNVRLLPAPYVSFERLRIADAGDSGGTSIIRVESFTMWLSVPPLLRGVLEAHKVELRRPVLHLATHEDGSTNWQNIAPSPGSFAFVPNDVALQSVAIDDGAVVLSTAQRGELARLDGIAGELTADALEGPFKFRGTVNWHNTPRQVRIATATFDANGDLRFKAAVDVTGSTNSYMLDGRLSDLKGRPTLSGDLTAKLKLAPSAKADAASSPAPAPTPDITDGLDFGPSTDTPGAVPEAPAALPPPPTTTTAKDATPGRSFELRAKVKGTTQGVDLDDIAVSLEAGAAPQLITGTAQFEWTERMHLDVALKSRWLDLDQISQGASVKSMPLEAGRSYFEALASALPTEADTNAELEFDQVTLGGEPISNVRLAAARSGGPLELKGVRAELPGGVRLELDGILTPTTGVPRLDGTLFASGKSLMRFLAWGLDNPDVGQGRNDGPFSLDGRFALGDGTLALTDATVQFAGTPLNGEFKLDLGERKEIAMAVEGPRIDVAQISSGLVSLESLHGLVFGTDAAATEDAAAKPDATDSTFDPATADVSLELKVAELVDGERVLTDVDTVVRFERGTLSIPRLRFSTPEGLSVEAEGDAKDVPARPSGAIRGLVAAPNPKAARTLLALLDSDGTLAADLDRLSALAPLRVAGTLTLAGGETNASRIALDGTLGGGRLTGALRLDGGRGAWRTAPLDLDATLDSPNIARLVATLFDAKIETGAEDAAKSGRVVIKAAGTPAEGLLALADAKADGLALRYRGQVRFAKPDETELDGELRVGVEDARIPLSLAGIATSEGAGGVPFAGTVHVARKGRQLTLDGESLRVGESTLSGRADLTRQDDGRHTIDARIKTNRVVLAGLLSPILSKAESAPAETIPEPTPPRRGQARQPAAAPAEPAVPVPSIWPEQSFDLSLLSRLDGKIEADIDQLVIEPGLTVGNAKLGALFTPDRLKITRLDGDAVGGKLASKFDIERAPAGIGLAGSVRIDVATTPAAGEASAQTPGDAAAFSVDFTSRALSPAAVISALTGKGELTVGDAVLTGNSPDGLSNVARAALTGNGPSSGEALTEAITSALKEGEVKLGKLSVPVELSDGALKLDKVRLEMPDGRSTFTTTVDIATMQIDSEWQIEPKLDGELAADASRAYLPPVTVVYTGKLSALDDLVPHVSAGALERELVVRKMEIDVGELERLRKLDEERARKDAERRRAEEAARAREEAERARIEAERQRALEDDQETAPAEDIPDGTAQRPDPVATPAPEAALIPPPPAPAAAPTPAPAPEQPPYDAAQWAACNDGANADAAIVACEQLFATAKLAAPERATVHYKYARALRDKGSLDAAIEHYGLAISLAPSADAFNHRGVALFEKGENEKAIDDFSEAVRLDAKLADAFNNRAWIRFTIRDLDAALADANRALALDDNKSYIWDTRGHIQEARGNRSGAISDFVKALELDDQSASSAEGLRRLNATAAETATANPARTAPSQRQPPRRKRSQEEEWRPFQTTPY